MIDLEDIFKSILDYARDELPLEDGGTISRLNYLISLKNAEKGDSLLDMIPNKDSRFVLNQRRKEQSHHKSWIDLAVAEDVETDSNFNTVAKKYAISLSSVIQDDLSYGAFYKSCRMAEVLKDLMVDYLSNQQEFGFMDGYVDMNSLPARVSIQGTKALQSGVVYIVTIQ